MVNQQNIYLLINDKLIILLKKKGWAIITTSQGRRASKIDIPNKKRGNLQKWHCGLSTESKENEFITNTKEADKPQAKTIRDVAEITSQRGFC